MKTPNDSRSIGAHQHGWQRDEFRTAVRALLMSPLMGALHEDLPLIRRNAERVREWFLRETGWMLVVERDGARLFKRPADLQDSTRGLPRYDRRRYVLLCLACAVLERSEVQISLRTLGERLLQLAADPVLAGRGVDFSLDAGFLGGLAALSCRAPSVLGVSSSSCLRRFHRRYRLPRALRSLPAPHAHPAHRCFPKGGPFRARPFFLSLSPFFLEDCHDQACAEADGS